MSKAEAQAAAEHKNILLMFGASWCTPCHRFESFLNDPAVGPLLAKSFVLVHLDVMEHDNDKLHADNPGAERLMSSLGGADTGIPFTVMLDPHGESITDSLRPDSASRGGSNIGFPTQPPEIDWFMRMLHRGAPNLTPQETATIRTWLEHH
jgi:hypothetical protein